MNASREYKNNVFTMLFSDERLLVDLYNALTGSKFPPDIPVEIATLTDVLFNFWRDDIAFVINGCLVILVEHQSTINENMPLRFFIYLARIYEKLIDKKVIYNKRLYKVPRPDFIVLYNGREPFPAEKTLRLSDAYMNIAVPFQNGPAYRQERSETPAIFGSASSVFNGNGYNNETSGLGGLLELEVRVVNINDGYNKEMVRRCEALNGYIKFNTQINKNILAGMTLNQAVTEAVIKCIEQGVLADFLTTHGSEVINMMASVYDAELEKQVIREEGFEEGIERGIEKGIEKGIERGIERGIEKGTWDTVRRFLEAGVDAELIAKTLGIPKSKLVK